MSLKSLGKYLIRYSIKEEKKRKEKKRKKEGRKKGRKKERKKERKKDIFNKTHPKYPCTVNFTHCNCSILSEKVNLGNFDCLSGII